ncbi:unnamed protein product [Chrysoparadoxa australica]
MACIINKDVLRNKTRPPPAHVQQVTDHLARVVYGTKQHTPHQASAVDVSPSVIQAALGLTSEMERHAFEDCTLCAELLEDLNEEFR